MGHRVRAFVGPLTALRPFVAAAPVARVFELHAGAPLPLLPLDEVVHEALHTAYGTGDWIEAGPLLSSTDLAFAAKASRGAALAYVETDYFGGAGRQCAVLWRDGAVVLKPTEMDAETGRTRPRSLWPINMALKGLGIIAAAGGDEFTVSGLGGWRHTEDIIAQARELPISW